MANQTPPTREEIKAKIDAIFARLIGLAATLIGITAVALTGWASYKVYLLERPTAPGFVLIGIFLAIALFFLQVGWRLLLNRPNRFGSILSPPGWRVLGVLFGVIGVGLLAFFAGTMAFTFDTLSTLAVPVIGSLVFSYWCFRSANRASRNAGAGGAP